MNKDEIKKDKIKKSLECCAAVGFETTCGDCQYCFRCGNLAKDALDLITEQEKEIDALKEKKFMDFISSKITTATYYETVIHMVYVYTDDDVRLPQREEFKTEQGYKDSLRCHIQRRTETVKKMQDAHDSAVAWFKKTTVELNIPCTAQIRGVVQEIEPLGGYSDY